MKKVPLFAFVIIAVLGLGCKNVSQVDNSGKFKIVTSFYPVYILTLNVIKDIPDIELKNLTPPQTGCLHDYQLSPNEVKGLEGATVLIINGAGMESFMSKIISSQPDLKIVVASKGIPLLKDNAGIENPHVWVSIPLAIREVQNIAEGLAVSDPARSVLYHKNAAAYIFSLQQLEKKFKKILAPYAGSEIITFHEAFPYFAADYNLKITSVIEREPGSSPTPKELDYTINLIKEKKVKALFAEPQYSSQAAEIIARESGLTVYQLDPVVTGEMKSESYVDIMRNNLDVLQKALK